MVKDLTVDSHVWPVCKNGKKTNNHQTCGTNGMKNLMPVAIQLGPVLQPPLISTPVTKTVQVLATSLSHCWTKLFKLQPALKLPDSINEASTMSSSHRSKEDKEAVLVEESKPEFVCVPPAVAQNHLISEEKPQALLPPLEALFSENSNPKPLVIWGQGNKVQEAQHQKQTSCRLLHFIKAKTENKDALDFTVFGSTEERNEANNSETSSVSATNRQQRNQLLTDNWMNARASKTLLTNDANSTSVFNVKSVNSSGNVTYSCMVMTETELWDVGEISAEMLQSNTLHYTSEYCDLQHPIPQATNSSEIMDGDPQNLHSRDCEQGDSSANSQTPTPNNLSIPDFEIRCFEEAEVVVSHISSPSSFYIQRADLNEKLQALVTE
ncbi:hypothetical protein FQA47_004715 [Oryzias melastigma]|uniref:Uncharacterized protein n=1 Tax=Oryzias melastigma TaxID=30732 RepID=A0A834CG94_ORYME|nr:hypothetical protein FQA47_004715 [Oryzias melastigma]